MVFVVADLHAHRRTGTGFNLILTLLAAVLCGYGGGRLALALTGPATAPVDQVTPGTVDQPDPDIAPVVRHWPPLFGTPPAEEAATPPPRVAVDYTLSGLVAQGNHGWALIGTPAGDLLVRPGDALPGGEVVAEIRRDAVLLRSAEGLGVIAFADAEGELGGEAGGTVESEGALMPPVSVAPAALPATGFQDRVTRDVPLTQLRDQDFRTAIARAGAMERVATRDGGSALRILWVRNGQLYAKVGLRKGDVVTAINGMSTSDTDAIMASLGTLLQQREFTLDLLRDGRPVALKVTVTE